ncbi:uncharacterized protein LOC109830210 [Asparagus officinalis]|uniref:uncharacterized protein LOC109830210 n=1 Tax=Asparagus officinalis TaxID=4686 RepID=UPI00098E3D50|nr:uncharacterized protein LOC109830210 [Asparagus officinalis]
MHGSSLVFHALNVQAIIALKKGAYLLKYGRRGKPKFCPFRLSTDESILIWYSERKEKQLKLGHVSRIIPGQRTAIFQRYPRPDKEYQSFSLIYSDRSLDVICKDKDEAEVWFVALKALISRGNIRKWRAESIRSERTSDANSPTTSTQKSSPTFSTDTFHKDSRDPQIPYEGHPVSSFGNLFSDVILYTAQTKSSFQRDSASNSLRTLSLEAGDISNGRGSAVDAIRLSFSSALSSSSYGSGYEEFDALGDVFIWGEGIGDGVLGGGQHKVGSLSVAKIDASLPKALESAMVLDVQNIACGSKHAAVVTKQGEVFSWGEESGGRLGHGVDADVSNPKLIDTLSGTNIEFVSCGEFHTCAVSLSGDLYTWGDGIHNSGLLGHGTHSSHWIPKKVSGQLEGLHVSSVSCGPWHTTIVTSAGQIFTFGDGTFGALGHGDRTSTNMPREIEALKGMRTIRAACGVWHTAAVVEIKDSSSDSVSSGILFTWGDGDKGRLGHGDKAPRLLPACVVSLSEHNFCQVECGNDVTIVLTTSGQVYTMGSNVYGQLGNPTADGKLPTCIDGKLRDIFVEEITCGSYHAALLTSKTEVYTWGRGANGRLGHGDNDNRSIPTVVEALKEKKVKNVVCGSTFTAVICLHKCVSSADQSVCSGCHLPFGFRRKRHNCYNCGLVFCKSCSSRKSVKASLAPSMSKPYRVCDGCYTKLKKATGDGVFSRKLKLQTGNLSQISNEPAEKCSFVPKLQGQLSRLSSVDSFKGESKYSRQHVIELNNGQLLPNLRENYLQSSQQDSSLNLSGSSKKMFSVNVPSSRAPSPPTSPLPSRPDPSYPITTQTITNLTSPAMIDARKTTDDNLSQEVVRLQLKVEELTHKCQLLEAELETTSRRLREATAMAGEETAKCNAATEVIKSLTEQLKDVSEKEPEGWTMNKGHGCGASHSSSSLKLPSNESSMAASLAPQSNGNSSNLLPCNGAALSKEEAEWVEQVEQGVYITVSSFPGGGKHLKRVRFSRKRFSEQKAEQWWAENRSKLQEKYSILSRETSFSRSPSTS